MRDIFKRIRNISISKKLYFTMGIMALLIIVELATLWFSVGTLSSVRAFVGGEGLWSKAQKDAIYYLEKYGRSHNESDYEAFKSFMAVPIGDHKARMAMSQAKLDHEAAREGFIEGRNHPSDVDDMIALFRYGHNISYISKAITVWNKADSISDGLFPIADRLHNQINSPAPSQARIDAILQEIDPINSQLTLLEDEFSYTLGEGSRWLEHLILKLLFSIALTVEISGLLLTVSVSRGIQKGLREINGAAGRVAQGDLAARAKKYSQDEIGLLADQFNRMTEQLNLHINERKHSVELLRESEERFKLLVENVKDYSIIMVDTAGRVISWNEGAQRITGYTSEEIIGKPISIFYTEEQIKAREPEINLRAALERGHYQREGWRRRKDGTSFWAEILYTALYGDDGQLTGYAKITRDITERKEAELELTQSQAQLAMAQQLARIGSWEWNLADNSLSWSDELYHIYGLNPKTDEISYDRVISMTHPGDIEYVQNVIHESRKTHRPFNFYHRIILPDGSIRVLHARGEIMLNAENKAMKIIGTNQDVTDRIHEEEMEKLAVAATRSNNSVIIADSQGKIEWVNEGFTKLTGYTIDDIRHSHGEILRAGGLTGLSQESEMYDTVIKKKKSVVYESKNFTKGGNEYWTITTLTPVIDKQGNVERIIAIDSDITERKRIEEDLILANRIAEHSLQKGNKALNDLMKAKKELEESMRVKEQFLAKMSHEIRTPMNAILGLTELMLENDISKEQKECLEAIKLSSDNLLSIINDILDFSKLESGKASVEQVPFNLDEVVEGVMLTLGLTAERKGLRFSYEKGASAPPPFLTGDPVKLRQVLLNLVSNSIKFTEHGSVTIHVEMLQRQDDSCTLLFSVTDTGIGIPQDRITTIFESFTQASNETSRKYGGTGLGLTIVRQLVELLGGTVAVESKVKEGSTFRVTLPFRVASVERITEQKESKEVRQESLGPTKLLLTEDNEMNQMLAAKVLRKWGIEPDIAENGKEAIEKLREKDYDLILMDIQMPEMDGYEATKFIRQQMPFPKSKVAIIAMTAHAIVGEAEKCIAIGMNDYISKPFNQRTLYEKIAQLLKKRKETLPAEEAKAEATSAPYQHIDMAYLNEIGEGSQEFLHKMINAFLRQTPEMLSDMQRYCEQQQWDDLKAVAHKMKPSMDFMGIHALKEPVRTLERYAMEKTNLDEIPKLVETVVTNCNLAMEELKSELVRTTQSV